jgi:hypothetical protein
VLKTRLWWLWAAEESLRDSTGEIFKGGTGGGLRIGACICGFVGVGVGADMAEGIDFGGLESLSMTASQPDIGRSLLIEAPFKRLCLISAAKLAPRCRRIWRISEAFVSADEKASQTLSS